MSLKRYLTPSAPLHIFLLLLLLGIATGNICHRTGTAIIAAAFSWLIIYAVLDLFFDASRKLYDCRHGIRKRRHF